MVFEWYNDHSQYHYIGYLLAMSEGNNVEIIKDLLSRKLSKNTFIDSIKSDIGELIHIKKKKQNSNELKSLSDLTYGKDNKYLIRILLLLDIEVLVNQNKENSRFPFHLFKKDKITSLEHIHPQNPDSIDTEEERCITWLKSHKLSLKHLTTNTVEQKVKIEELLDAIEKLIKQFNSQTFKTVYSDVIDIYSEISDIKDSEIDTLYNLARPSGLCVITRS